MWANAQRDGRPAERRWRPLFNAEFCRGLWHQKMSPWAIAQHCLHDLMFSHFSRAPTCDRHMTMIYTGLAWYCIVKSAETSSKSTHKRIDQIDPIKRRVSVPVILADVWAVWMILVFCLELCGQMQVGLAYYSTPCLERRCDYIFAPDFLSNADQFSKFFHRQNWQ